MAPETTKDNPVEPIVTIDEVNRVLEVGRILLSVLPPEELDQLRQILSNQVIDNVLTIPFISETEIGNTGVT